MTGFSLFDLRVIKTSRPLCRLALLAGAAALLPACQHMDGLNKKNKGPVAQAPMAQTLQGSKLGNNLTRGPRTSVSSNYGARPDNVPDGSVRLPSDVGRVPTLSSGGNFESGAGSNNTAPRSSVRTIDAYVAPLPIPEFINVVYGEMLKVPFVPGKNVAAMTDIISLRSSGKMKTADFQALVELALEEYGILVVPEAGTYKLVQDDVLRSRIPAFIKSRARARVRDDLRPIVQFVEMQAVEANSVLPLLYQTFGRDNKKIKISANPQSNFIVLSGFPEDVNAALAVVNELDELEFAGSDVRRYTPQYWNSDEFSKVLERALKTEGWEVSSNDAITRGIFLMPVEYSNDIFIFAKTPTMHERVNSWIMELDRPVKGGDSEQIYIYQVQNVDAEILATTANAVLQPKGGTGAYTGPATAATGLDRTAGGVSAFGGQGDFTVDPLGNRIIFTCTANEYTKLVNLLEQLDTPAPEVLIEVQIAEVTINDDSSLGIEMFIDDLGGERVGATFQTEGGLDLGSAGLNVNVLSGNVDAAINAFAKNRRVKLLSTPVLTARSGSEASIQVGQDVPVITSQRAADNQTGTGATDILQSIDYRSTGVLLSIEPIVFSDDRIDLTISQEVSSTIAAPNSPVSSPTISSRTLQTVLTLEDGQTAVMGGLIQETYTREDTGVPFLKDIPGIGQVFSNDTYSKGTTELVVLITAYVLRGQADKDQFVNRLSGRVDRLLLDDSRMVTLRPRQF